MKRLVTIFALAVVLLPAIGSDAAAQTWTGMWEVRVTNLTTSVVSRIKR